MFLQQLPTLKLPTFDEEWLEADRAIADSVVPAVLAAFSVDDKNTMLCEGVYQVFANKFGCISTYKPRRQRRQRKHARRLKRLTSQKNTARKQLHQAKASSAEPSIIKELSCKLYKLVHLHSAEKKILLKSKCRFEALKARRECNSTFWRYAAKLFDDEDNSVVPAFDVSQAEEYFKKIYAVGPNQFSHSHWLPSPPTPSVPFDSGDITRDEIAQVVKKARSRSAASPLDGISYKIIKRCPSLLPALSSLFSACWESASVPLAGSKQ